MYYACVRQLRPMMQRMPCHLIGSEPGRDNAYGDISNPLAQSVHKAGQPNRGPDGLCKVAMSERKKRYTMGTRICSPSLERNRL